MEKVKYYQIAFKGESFKKLVSPSKQTIDSLIADGYQVFGYDDLSSIPVNPILANGVVREKTQAELDAGVLASKLAVNKFPRLAIRRAMRELGVEDNLDTLLANPAFGKDWADATEIDLSDVITAQAITAYGGDIDAIKLKIAEMK